MARRLMSPTQMRELREKALRLYEGGASSHRAIGAVLGVAHTTVLRWVRAQRSDGSPPPVRFDRHETGGYKWDASAATEQQQVRRRRRQTAAGTVVALREEHAAAVLQTPPSRRRPRRQGAELTDYVRFGALRVKNTDRLDRHQWATPRVRHAIALIIAGAGNAGVRTMQVLVRLPSAFHDDSAEFCAEFECVLVLLGYARRADGRWIATSRES